VAAAVKVRYNGSINPKFAVDSAHWTTFGGTQSRVVGGGPTDAPNFQRITVTGTPAAAAVAHQYGLTLADAAVVAAGQRVRPSVYVRASTTRNVQMSIRFINSSGAAIGSDVFGTIAGLTANVWTRVGMNGTTVAPAGAVGYYVVVQGASTAWTAGQTLDVTGLNALTSATTDSLTDAYWDGSTVLSDGFYRGWSGDVGQSVSIATQSPVDPCSWCAEFVLSYLPAQTELTVDAILERAFASVKGGEAQPADSLLYATDGGPMTWPALSCGIDYLFAFDVPFPLLDDVRVTFELARKA